MVASDHNQPLSCGEIAATHPAFSTQEEARPRLFSTDSASEMEDASPLRRALRTYLQKQAGVIERSSLRPSRSDL